MNSILAAELLKVRKRWMPYIIFLTMLVGVSMLIWLAGYVSYHNSPFEMRNTTLRTFTLPWSIPALLDSGQFWGAVLVSVLTSSVVATEYNWGTVRGCISRGQRRGEYLAYKLLGLTVVAAVTLLAALAVGVIFSIIAGSLAGRPLTLDTPQGYVSPADIVVMILRAGVAVLPYGLLAFCVTVVTRSTAFGAAGTIVYMFGELIVVSILRGLGGAAADLRDVSIGHNAAALMAQNRLGLGDFNSMAPREITNPAQLPEPAVALFVIVVYCVAFLVIAFAVFRRRDLR